MKVITVLLGVVGLLALFYLGLLFANLSRRLGDVTKMPEHYRWFRAANVFIALAVASQVTRGITLSTYPMYSFLKAPWFALVTFHIPLAIGLTFDLVLVWYYWAWILKEKIE